MRSQLQPFYRTVVTNRLVGSIINSDNDRTASRVGEAKDMTGKAREIRPLPLEIKVGILAAGLAEEVP